MRIKGKTAFISGASRGIGKAIALALASEGANIIIAAKTAEPHPKLPGTIYTTAEEIVNAGGKAIPVIVDIRHEEMIQNAIDQGVDKFGGIDFVVNNASAISLTTIEQTSMKRYDLMHDINVRGTFLVSKLCIPHLKRADNPHILTLSPPLNLRPEWFGAHLAYTMSKYAMSMSVLGQSHELKRYGIASNALWPKTTIATAAVNNLLGGESMMKASRLPAIMADAAGIILSKDSKICTGNFFIDEEVLRSEGVKDFSSYAVDPSMTLMKDLFVE